MHWTERSPLIRWEEIPAAYSQHLQRTRQALYLRLADAPAGETLRPYFERGKMLRALLVFAASAAVGGTPEQVAMAAEAIELLHGASLFHDDIMDHAAERRGMPSLHKRLGSAQALVIGDHLLLLAFAALAEARAHHPADRVLEAMNALNRFARECCRGQFEELCADRWISEEQYVAMVAGKTAAPFVAAGFLGALLGGGSSTQQAAVCTFAKQMGIAFQIDDDLLDLTGERVQLGKPVGNSLAHRRPMLPLILLWQFSSAADRKRVRHLMNLGDSRPALVDLLEQNGIFDRVRLAQERHIELAISALAELPQSSGTDALRALATRSLRGAVQLVS